MKKRLFLFVGLFAAVLLYFGFRSSSSKAIHAEAEPAAAINQKRPEPAPSQTATTVAPPASTSSVLETKKTPQQKPSADKTVVHSLAEFRNGQFDNTVVAETLRMGSDTTPTTFDTGYKLFGIFHSIEEQVGAPFDMVNINYEATVPEQSGLALWLRTQSADGLWSPWQEVAFTNLNQTIFLDSPAVAWQYRLNFYANDPANSPQIRKVAVSTHDTTPVASVASSNSPETSLKQP